MSYHWENVIWQSKDGSWNRGFYKRISMAPMGGHYDEEYDSEWDDDFDFGTFDYAKTGFPSETAAANWQPGANPGGFEVVPYRGNSKECKALDQLAFFHKFPAEKAKFERKELLRKNREHFKKLAEEWDPERIGGASRSMRTVRVTLKSDERAYDHFGAQTILEGSFKKNGDWLEVEGRRIYNTKTSKFEKHVHKLEEVAFRAPSYYGRRW